MGLLLHHLSYRGPWGRDRIDDLIRCGALGGPLAGLSEEEAHRLAACHEHRKVMAITDPLSLGFYLLDGYGGKGGPEDFSDYWRPVVYALREATGDDHAAILAGIKERVAELGPEGLLATLDGWEPGETELP